MGRAWLTAVVVGLGVVLGACTGDESPSGTATVEVSATAEVSATGSPSPTAEQSTTPELEPISAKHAVSGLFEDQRPAPTADRQVTVGASPFGAHDGVSTTLYDFESRVAHDLGPGTAGAFGPDRETFAWRPVADEVLERARTGARTGWSDDWSLGVLQLSTLDTTIFDAAYERCATPLQLVTRMSFVDDDVLLAIMCVPSYVNVDDGQEPNVEERLAFVTPTETALGVDTLAPVVPRDGRGRTRWIVWLPGTDFRVVLAVDALFVREISDHEVGVGVPTGAFGEPWNFFIVDVTTREATFIATVPWGGRADADAEYAAWSTEACGYASGSPGVTYVLERASGEIVEIDQGMWPVIDDGQLGDWGSGFRLIVDLGTFEPRALPPREFGRAVWSEDGRYASLGWFPEVPSNAVPCEFAIEGLVPS